MATRIGRLKPPQVVAALGALAHETRLAAYRLMVEAGPEGVPAGVVAARLNVVPSSLTFHLQALVHAGLVTQRRLSRQVIYAADFAAMNGLVAFLTSHCCGRETEPCIPFCDPARPSAVAARSGRRSA